MSSDHLTRIETKLDRIEEKIDRIDSRQDKVDVHLAIYNEQLGTHIKRTEILEKVVEPVVAITKGARLAAWIGGFLSGAAALYAALKGLL
jgi:hypothetical protein